MFYSCKIIEFQEIKFQQEFENLQTIFQFLDLRIFSCRTRMVEYLSSVSPYMDMVCCKCPIPPLNKRKFAPIASATSSQLCSMLHETDITSASRSWKCVFSKSSTLNFIRYFNFLTHDSLLFVDRRI